MSDELDAAIASARQELEALRRRHDSPELEALRRQLREVRAECEALEARLAPLRDEERRLREATR